MKQTIIQITHIGEAFDQEAIENAFGWIGKQMTAADLADCTRVDVQTKVGGTTITFGLFDLEEAAETLGEG